MSSAAQVLAALFDEGAVAATVVDAIAARFNYWAFIALMLIGLYALITQRHLVRKVVGLTIFQTAIILFFLSTAAKWPAGIPIVPPGARPEDIDPTAFVNPLPHALMLTAIVVGVAILGVAMALVLRIQEHFGTLDEDELLRELE